MLKYFVIFFVLVVSSASGIKAQETVARGTVVYIAGPNVYVSIGRSSGVAPGDTLTIENRQVSLGQWLVISSSSKRSVIKSLDENTLTIGTEVTIRIPEKIIPENDLQIADATEQDAGVEGSDASVTAGPDPPRKRKPRRQRRSRVSGRISANMNGTFSETNSVNSGTASIKRTTALPSISLSVNGSNLPGNIKARLSARVFYRYSDSGSFSDPTSSRIYVASLKKDFLENNLSVSVGRFSNQHERFSGNWDGLVVRAGHSKTGFGFATGFQPDRFNEGFSSQLPKYTAFANVGTKGKRVRYDGSFSFTDVHGKGDYSRQMILGAEQNARMGRSRLRTEFQVKRDPTTNSWKIVRLRASSNISVTKHIFVDAIHDRRRSFSVWNTSSIPVDARLRSTVSLRFRDPSKSFSISATRSEYGSFDPYHSFATSGSFRGLPNGISISSYISYWSQVNYNGLSFSSDIGRDSRSTSVRLRYRYSQNSIQDQTIGSHSITPSISYRPTRRMNLTGQASLLKGSLLTNYSFFSGLSVSF